MSITYPTFVPAKATTFEQKYRNFAPIMNRADLNLWSELNNEAAFSHMRSATECWDYPAVAGITKQVAPILDHLSKAEQNHIKKAIGAMVCCIMEANGYIKTDIKRSVPPIPCRVFSRAEVYQRHIEEADDFKNPD